jgi:hypothetical protein
MNIKENHAMRSKIISAISVILLALLTTITIPGLTTVPLSP